MKKVLIIEASPRKGFTKKAAERVRDKLSGTAEIEIIHLYDEEINLCNGCCACLIAGSVKCPLHDDAAYTIHEKMMKADGVIYVVPNYALQVPAGLKNLLDRLAFVFHRPRFFNIVSMTIVVEGVYGSKNIIKYMNEVMGFWGMRIAKGTAINGGVYPNRALDHGIEAKNEQKLDKAVANFAKELDRNSPKAPSLFRVIMFRAARTSMKNSPDALPADKAYFQEKGWFHAPYYHQVPLSILHKGVGGLVDRIMRRMMTRGAVKGEENS